MKSLRDLLQTLLSWLAAAIAAWVGTTTNDRRPAHGPAHPRRYVRATRTSATGVGAPVAPWLAALGHAAPTAAVAPVARRPTRPPLPPHLAALLASAPDIEPEFAPKPPRAVRLAALVRGAARSVRAFAPRPPPRDARAPTPSGGSWLLRMSRATSEVHAWLVLADPPPKKGLSPRPASA